MPGFEVIGAEEQAEIDDIFARGGVLFRHGFDALRNDCYKVRDFEGAFASYMSVPHALAVSSGNQATKSLLKASRLWRLPKQSSSRARCLCAARLTAR
jgi:8-amino-3,8-dideoxy-alpha-D-manno-octulosonate transaminase